MPAAASAVMSDTQLLTAGISYIYPQPSVDLVMSSNIRLCLLKLFRAHLKVMRLGCPSTGGLWLHTMWATGRRGPLPVEEGSSLVRPTT